MPDRTARERANRANAPKISIKNGLSRFDAGVTPQIGLQLQGREVVQLQRLIGNRATARIVATQRIQPAPTKALQRKGKDFSDLDSTQFRVSGGKTDRKIEVVERTQKPNGQVVYFATGEVTGFNGKRPIIRQYDVPVSLGNWYPSVTHINGMAVAPQSGLNSAVALLDAVNDAMGSATDSAFDQSAIDVLYTYSAQRGGLVSDLWDCIKGKVRVNDRATGKQVEIMLDAITRKKRTTVSAHSRGTIKTDNAVRKVHKKTTRDLLPSLRKQHYNALVKKWEGADTGIGIGPKEMAEMELYRMAEQEAKQVMDRYIQLIYAGNAVQYPSSALKPTLFVGGLDFVSMTVGSYTKLISGAKSVGKLAGHGFSKNYSKAVGTAIAQDIRNR
ncbi:MAG: hypothetical protein IPM16_18970 [Chloroflexi bacterium]|nr:hypothetical protein [Chloroflexota bacterium]